VPVYKVSSSPIRWRDEPELVLCGLFFLDKTKLVKRGTITFAVLVFVIVFLVFVLPRIINALKDKEKPETP